jgi:hypothetical protein
MSCKCGKIKNKECCCKPVASSLLCGTTTCPPACETVVSSNCVIYSGPNINCINVVKGDRITKVFENIIEVLGLDNCVTTTTTLNCIIDGYLVINDCRLMGSITAFSGPIGCLNDPPIIIPTTTIAPTTTVAPTTVAPTTVLPTTLAPTTVAPTTLVPTTLVPTTVAPTTVAPTTVAPTTVAPTTIAPTTIAPTTLAPTTVAPTTLAPTTIAPTTVLPLGCLDVTVDLETLGICEPLFEEDYFIVTVTYLVNGVPTSAPFNISYTFLYSGGLPFTTTNETILITAGSSFGQITLPKRTLLDCTDRSTIVTWSISLINPVITPLTIPMCVGEPGATTTVAPTTLPFCPCYNVTNDSLGPLSLPITPFCKQDFPSCGVIAPGDSCTINLSTSDVLTLQSSGDWSVVACPITTEACFGYLLIQGDSVLNPALGGQYFGYGCCSTAPPVDILDQLSDWTSAGNNEWFAVVCGRQSPYSPSAINLTIIPINSTTLTPIGTLASTLIDCSGCGGLVPNP